jgi:hypothetical protein
MPLYKGDITKFTNLAVSIKILSIGVADLF